MGGETTLYKKDWLEAIDKDPEYGNPAEEKMAWEVFQQEEQFTE